MPPRKPTRRPRGRHAGPYAAGPYSGPLLDDADLAAWLNPRIWLAAVAIVALTLAPAGLVFLLRPTSAVSSALIGVGLYIPCVIFAGMALHFGRATPLKSRLVAAGFAAGGLAFAVFAGVIDYGQRAVTLFESEVAVGGAMAPQELTFTVEHPGVEHRLTVFPTGAGPFGASASVGLRVELLDSAGATVLAHDETLAPHSSRSSTDWDTIVLGFTPRAGAHTLRLTPLTGGIPRLHVRVEDPLKRDGRRMPGY